MTKEKCNTSKFEKDINRNNSLAQLISISKEKYLTPNRCNLNASIVKRLINTSITMSRYFV